MCTDSHLCGPRGALPSPPIAPRGVGVKERLGRRATERGNDRMFGLRVVPGHSRRGVLMRDFSLRRRWAVGRIALFGWFVWQFHVLAPQGKVPAAGARVPRGETPYRLPTPTTRHSLWLVLVRHGKPFPFSNSKRCRASESAGNGHPNLMRLPPSASPP